jgi:hypothetical protein
VFLVYSCSSILIDLLYFWCIRITGRWPLFKTDIGWIRVYIRCSRDQSYPLKGGWVHRQTETEPDRQYYQQPWTYKTRFGISLMINSFVQNHDALFKSAFKHWACVMINRIVLAPFVQWKVGWGEEEGKWRLFRQCALTVVTIVAWQEWFQGYIQEYSPEVLSSGTIICSKSWYIHDLNQFYTMSHYRIITNPLWIWYD